MVDPVALHLWSWRLLYPLICAVIVFAQLIPLQTTPMHIPPPDLLVALTCAWVVRRPDQIPVISVAVVFFLADILLQRPPGLGVALMIVATEFLRSRSPFMREFPFLLEWGVVLVVIMALAIGMRLPMQIMMLPPPPFDLAAREVVATAFVYPICALICHFILKVRYLHPGDRESSGGYA